VAGIKWRCGRSARFLVRFVLLALLRRSSSARRRARSSSRAVHSCHIGDYVASLTFGVAVIGGLFAVTIR